MSYIVTEDQLYGDIHDLPLSTVQEMIEEQIKQGNPADVTVFQQYRYSDRYQGGFDWIQSDQGYNYWDELIP